MAKRKQGSLFQFGISKKAKSDESDDNVESGNLNTTCELLIPENVICCNSNSSVSTLPSSVYQQPWPDVWDAETWTTKKKTYPWLDCENGKLGCKLCSKVGNTGCYKSQGVSLSSVWKDFDVSYYGNDRQAKLKSLRKKISEHLQSAGHKLAAKISEDAGKDTLKVCVDQQNKSHLDSTCKVFRTAYHIAKLNRPYSDHPHLVELQEVNMGKGTLGIGLHSRHSAAEIITHVAEEMRNKICKQIQSISGKISILIDEATQINNRCALIIYIKCETDKTKPPHVMFLDLVELENQDARTIADVLLSCLSRYGFDDKYLKQNLVAFVSDGASVMLGKNSGVSTQVKKKYPDVIVWHCLNHRLELAVGDSVDDVTQINHFKSLLDKIYTIFSRSPKNEKEIRNCSERLGDQFHKIGRVLGTRWVASSHRTVSAIWNDHNALCVYFENASKDTNRKSSDRATYSGLLKRLGSPEFILDLGIMCDVLFELSELSLQLQKRNTSIVYADRLIKRTITYLETLKQKSGTNMLNAEIAAKEGVFGSVQLISNAKHVCFNHKQFLTSLIDRMRQRMFCTISGSENEYSSLLQQLTVLDPSSWPHEIDAMYGEKEVMDLCKQFKISFSASRNAFRDFLENGGRKIPEQLTPLINCSCVIPISTAECERGFSQMNLIVTPSRNSLSVEHVASLLFVKMHGPPMTMWQPENYVLTWLRKHRTADDTRIKKSKNTDPEEPDPAWEYL